MCAAVSLPRPFFLLFVLLSLFELPQHKKLDILFYRGQTSDFPWAKQPIQGSALAGITSVSARKSWPQLNFCATLLINNQFQHCRIYHLSMHHRPGSASGVRLLDMWIHSFYFPPSTSLYFFSIYFPTSKGEKLSFWVSKLSETTSNVSLSSFFSSLPSFFPATCPFSVLMCLTLIVR